ncbi:hypothetical protein HK104_006490, partial [Borealophlyctis nickersoniae]
MPKKDSQPSCAVRTTVSPLQNTPRSSSTSTLSAVEQLQILARRWLEGQPRPGDENVTLVGLLDDPDVRAAFRLADLVALGFLSFAPSTTRNPHLLWLYFLSRDLRAVVYIGFAVSKLLTAAVLSRRGGARKPKAFVEVGKRLIEAAML